LKISRAQAAGGVAQVGECLPSKRKALISKPILTKRKKRERERERERERIGGGGEFCCEVQYIWRELYMTPPVHSE
jgi:hypothetical protein